MDSLLNWIHKYKDLFDALGSLATAMAVIISLSLILGNRPKLRYLIIGREMHAPNGGPMRYERLRVSVLNKGTRATRCFNFYVRTGRLWYKERFRIDLKENPILNDGYEPLSLWLSEGSVVTAYIDFNDFLRVTELSRSQLKALWIGLSTSNGRYEARIPESELRYWLNTPNEKKEQNF